MREIKFRAWDKKCNQWANLDQLSDWETCEVTAVVGMGNDTYPYQTFTVKSDNRFEVMQYTGLKDKNGKEIYEGDILETFNYSLGTKHRFTCVFEDGCFFTRIGLPYGGDDREVIGNIYEHLELIKN